MLPCPPAPAGNSLSGDVGKKSGDAKSETGRTFEEQRGALVRRDSASMSV
jgi:hypothetical protein